MGIRVRAKSVTGEGRVVGYVGLKRIREGEEFDIENEKAFSSKWMERIDEDEKPASKGKAAPKGNPVKKPTKAELEEAKHSKVSIDEEDELEKGEES